MYRDAVTDDGFPIRLHPAVEPTGYIWVTGITDGVLRVKVEGAAKDVPPNEPLRYRVHVCHLVMEPYGGG